MLRSSIAPASGYSPAEFPFKAMLLTVLIVISPATAFQDETQTFLERALRLADLYNWAGAASDFSEAERGFLATGDKRNALLAKLGRIRARIEQDKRGLPAVSEELAQELDTNEILVTDKRLRLFALVVKGDIDGEMDTALMKSDWIEVQKIATELGDQKWQYRALAQLGLAAFYDGDLETARANVSTAVTAATAAGDRGTLIRYLSAMGIGLVHANMSEQALPHFENALKIAASVPESGYPFVTQEGKMAALLGLKRIGEAEVLASEVIEKAREASRRAHETQVLRTLAGIQIARGNHPQALAILNDGIAIAEPAGLLRLLAELQTMKAELLAKSGDLAGAEKAAQAAALASQESGESWGVPRRLQLLAELYSQRGNYAEADDTYDRAESFVDTMVGKASA